MRKCASISDLESKILSKITDDKDEIIFETECGKRYKMHHEQDCCEYVTLEDVCGDFDDLIGEKIVSAYEKSNEGDHDGDSATWTFYTICTAKNSVTLRWYGESSGYYSEEVDFELIAEKDTD